MADCSNAPRHLVTLTALILAFGSLISVDAIRINLNEPNITFGAFNRNFTIPWPLPVGKAIFWYFWVAALATGKKRRRKRGAGEEEEEEDVWDQMWGENIQTDLSEALQTYVASQRSIEANNLDDDESGTFEEDDQEEEEFVEEGPQNCLRKLACEVASQRDITEEEIEQYRSYVGEDFLRLVEEERSADVDEDGDAMLMVDCGQKHNCVVEKRLMAQLGKMLQKR